MIINTHFILLLVFLVLSVTSKTDDDYEDIPINANATAAYKSVAAGTANFAIFKYVNEEFDFISVKNGSLSEFSKEIDKDPPQFGLINYNCTDIPSRFSTKKHMLVFVYYTATLEDAFSLTALDIIGDIWSEWAGVWSGNSITVTGSKKNPGVPRKYVDYLCKL